MAFTDPQSVTISGTAKSLARTGITDSKGTFSLDDGNVVLEITQQRGKRNRRTIRLNFSKIAADPLISAQNIKYSMSTYLVVDVPVTGFTVQEAKAVVDGFMAYLTASSGAKITQLLGGEI